MSVPFLVLPCGSKSTKGFLKITSLSYLDHRGASLHLLPASLNLLSSLLLILLLQPLSLLGLLSPLSLLFGFLSLLSPEDRYSVCGGKYT